MLIFWGYLGNERFYTIILIVDHGVQDDISILDIESNISSHGKSYLFCDYRRYANPEAIPPFRDSYRHIQTY